MPSIYLAFSKTDTELGGEFRDKLGVFGYAVRDHTNLNPETQPLADMQYVQSEMAGTIALLTPASLKDKFFEQEVNNALQLSRNTDARKFLLILLLGVSKKPAEWDSADMIRLNEQDPVGTNIPLVTDYLVRNGGPGSPNAERPFSSAFGSQFGGGNQMGDKHPRYWLLKINDETWPVKDFGAGQPYHFHTAHHLNSRQSDYDLFKSIAPGDFIFAYALPKINAIVALFEVKEGLHSENDGQELISLELYRLIVPSIPNPELEGLPFYDRLNYEASEKLYKVDTPIASGLLADRELVPAPYTAGKSGRRKAGLTRISSDGNSGVDDELGIAADVEAIASLIAYREVQPPLSFGLFGNWGSGKSFFMEKLEKRLDELAKGNEEYYCRSIVPIRFNSWHYSDADLWASLSSRIFEELASYGKDEPDKLANLFKNLKSTEQQLDQATMQTDAAAAALAAVTKRYKDTQDDIKKKVQSLEEVSLTSVARAVLCNKTVKEEIAELDKEADFVNWDDLDEIKKQADELKSSGGRLIATLRQAYAFRKMKWVWALLLFCGMLLLGWYARLHLGLLQSGFEFVGQFIFWLTTVGAQLLIFVRPANKVIESVSGKLTSLADTMKRLQQDEEKRLQDQHASLTLELAAARDQEQRLRNQQDQLAVKQALLQSEITDIKTGKKVISFIEKRVTDEKYVNSLGMISWVRKDFEMLDYLLKQQHEAESAEEKVDTFQIDRIVLYIDGLDRCLPLTVIKVLEAIHMLLAFPLFVVIVGVDPQWMESALSTKFAGILAKEEGLPADLVLSPVRYLEKIFQVPFRLKPVSQRGFSDLVASQFEHVSPQEIPPPVTVNEIGLTEDLPVAPALAPASTDPGDGPVNLPGTVKKTIDLLVISPEEIEYMQSLSAIIPNSPRTIKRFVNIYRIVRAHADFQFDDGEDIWHYQAVMLMLAVMLYNPLEAKAFFNLMEGKDETFGSFLTQRNSAMTPEQIIGVLVNNYNNKGPVSKAALIPLSCFRINIPLVSRFTFYYK